MRHRHHFIAPERWSASMLLKSQAKRRTPTVMRLESQYGDHGLRLIAAGFFWATAGTAVGVASLVVPQLPSSRRSEPVAGWILLGISLTLLALAVVRFRQATLEGRRFVRTGRTD